MESLGLSGGRTIHSCLDDFGDKQMIFARENLVQTWASMAESGEILRRECSVEKLYSSEQVGRREE